MYLGVFSGVRVIGGVYGFTLVAVKLMRRAFVYVLKRRHDRQRDRKASRWQGHHQGKP